MYLLKANYVKVSYTIHSEQAGKCLHGEVITKLMKVAVSTRAIILALSDLVLFSVNNDRNLLHNIYYALIEFEVETVVSVIVQILPICGFFLNRNQWNVSLVYESPTSAVPHKKGQIVYICIYTFHFSGLMEYELIHVQFRDS